MYVKFKKDWPSITGPVKNEKGRVYPKGWEGHLTNVDAQVALDADYAEQAEERKEVKIGNAKVETTSKQPKAETRKK